MSLSFFCERRFERNKCLGIWHSHKDCRQLTRLNFCITSRSRSQIKPASEYFTRYSEPMYVIAGKFLFWKMVTSLLTEPKASRCVMYSCAPMFCEFLLILSSSVIWIVVEFPVPRTFSHLTLRIINSLALYRFSSDSIAIRLYRCSWYEIKCPFDVKVVLLEIVWVVRVNNSLVKSFQLTDLMVDLNTEQRKHHQTQLVIHQLALFRSTQSIKHKAEHNLLNAFL